MLLLIDAGNTHTVFAVWKDTAVTARWRLSTHANRTEDEYAVWLLQLMRHAGIAQEDIEAAVIGSVVPQADFSMRRFVEKYFNLSPLMVGDPGIKTGVEVILPRPQEVGADRLVNALAAWRLYGGPAIVVDFGTATTFDVINGRGHYIGGIIAPGIHLSLQALHVAAAKLPNIAVARPEKIIGTSTEQAMQSGIYYGYAGLIDGIIGRLRQECGAQAKTIATGGLAPLFAEAAAAIDVLEPDLTLRGLKYIYDLNHEK